MSRRRWIACKDIEHLLADRCAAVGFKLLGDQLWSLRHRVEVHYPEIDHHACIVLASSNAGWREAERVKGVVRTCRHTGVGGASGKQVGESPMGNMAGATKLLKVGSRRHRVGGGEGRGGALLNTPWVTSDVRTIKKHALIMLLNTEPGRQCAMLLRPRVVLRGAICDAARGTARAANRVGTGDEHALGVSVVRWHW